MATRSESLLVGYLDALEWAHMEKIKKSQSLAADADFELAFVFSLAWQDSAPTWKDPVARFVSRKRFWSTSPVVSLETGKPYKAEVSVQTGRKDAFFRDVLETPSWKRTKLRRETLRVLNEMLDGGVKIWDERRRDFVELSQGEKLVVEKAIAMGETRDG